MAMLGSQGIVVKCTAAIFFRTMDWPQFVNELKTPPVRNAIYNPLEEIDMYLIVLRFRVKTF